MAKPVTTPTAFASTANYTAASGVPAGLVGTPVRISPPASFSEFGFAPNTTLKSQWLNTTFGLTVDWVRWVSEGTSAADATAHIVETVASGRANVRLIHVGTSPVEPYFPANMLEVETEVGYGGLYIETLVTSLHALDILAASTGSPAVRITQTGAGQSGLEVYGPGGVGVAAVSVDGGSGTGITATVTGANGSGIEGYATAGSVAGVYGEGAAVGVRGVCTATNGSGGRFDTNGSAGSTSEAVDARAYASGVGVRAASVNGSAMVSSCSGTADSIVVLASGTGAAMRLDAQALPATERAGQIWVEEIDSNPNRVTYKCMTNDTGLVGPNGSHFWNGADPLISSSTFAAAALNIAEGVTSTGATLVIENPYAFTVDVWVEAQFTGEIITPGSIALDTSITAYLRDNTAGTNFFTESMSSMRTTSKDRFCCGAVYTLPAATVSTILLRIQVNTGGGGGDMDFTNRSLRVITYAGGAR